MSESNESNLIKKIISVKESLPKKQRYLCDYVLKNYQALGLVTVKELADQAGVGISTVMRLLDALHYDTFNEFRQDIYKESVPSKWTLKNSLLSYETSDDRGKTLSNVWEKNIELLNHSIDEDLINQFEEAVEILIHSNAINIIGMRPYRAAAYYMEQLLGEFFSNIRQLSQDIDLIYDKVLQLKQEDVIVVFAFEPYTNLVIDTAKLAHAQGNKVILITDYISCPIASVATSVLKMPVSQEQFSIVPLISLVDAIVIEAGKYASKTSVDKLKKLEEVLRENNVIYDNFKN